MTQPITSQPILGDPGEYSQESREWLSQMIKVGFTAQRGEAWHYREGDDNHYPGAVPLDVVKRLFDFDVQKEEIEVAGQIQEDTVAWYSPDFRKVFGYFSPGAKIHLYSEWLVEHVSTLLGGELEIGTAGLLRDRAWAFVQAELPSNLTDDTTGEAFRASILAATSLDGTLATNYQIAFTRVLCDNTLRRALGEQTARVRIRHTRNSELRFEDTKRALGLLSAESEKMLEESRTLSAIKITPRDWAKFLDAYVPVPEEKGRGRTMAENKREALEQLWTSDDRVAPWTGTAWGVEQAVNTYNHHLSVMRNTAARFERNMTNALRGKTEDADREALKILASVVDNDSLVAVA